MNTNQVEMVSVDSLVPATHPYKKLKSLMDFDRIIKSVKVDESSLGAIGFTVPRLVLCLILQFIENLSDRGMLKNALKSDFERQQSSELRSKLL